MGVCYGNERTWQYRAIPCLWQSCQVSRILRDSPAFDLPVRKSSRIVKCPAKHRKPTKITFFADIGGISVLAVIRHYTATPAFTSTPLLRYLSDIDGNLC